MSGTSLWGDQSESLGNQTGQGLLSLGCMAKKGPVKLMLRVKIAHSFVPLYHFKLAYLVLHMAAKEFSKTTSKTREIGYLLIDPEWFQLHLEISLIHST